MGRAETAERIVEDEDGEVRLELMMWLVRLESWKVAGYVRSSLPRITIVWISNAAEAFSFINPRGRLGEFLLFILSTGLETLN